MPKEAPILFTYKEIAECLIKQKGIHEGIWGLYVQFGIGAANIPGPQPKDERVFPAAIVPIINMGIQRFQKENDLTVDAAKVNPASSPKARPKKSKRREPVR